MLMMEIVISQNENQNIRVENQNIEIQNKPPQELDIEQERNQTILIDGGGNVYGITDVLVNGVSVVSEDVAYVIVPTKTSDLLNDSGFITRETDPTVPSYVKAISLADINNWNNKQNELISGSNIKTINNTSLLGSGNINIEGNVYTAGDGISIENNVITNQITSYNDLTNLPTIPSNTSQLINDSDFVIASNLSEVAFDGSYTSLSDTPDIPTDTSDLTNNSGFITNTVNDLTNYTLSSNLSTVALTGNYNDLTNKPTIPDVYNATLTLQRNGTTLDTFTANSNTNKSINIIVPTQTSDLTNDSGYVKNIDTSSYSVAGVLKSGGVNSFNVNNTQYAYCETHSYADYQNKTNANFISKGTLENVITGKGLVSNDNVEIYSTTEQKIGKWINNKPIYRKVINFSGSDLNTSKAHGITNIDLITNATGMIHYSNAWKPLTVFYINNNTLEGYFSVALYNIDGTNFEIRAGDWYTTGGTTVQNDSFVIIEYTKTTD